VRLAYFSPATDIDCRDVVCKAREPAVQTEERILRFAIIFIDMTATRASSTGVSGVNQHNGHTGQLALVLDKGTQLVERPRMQSRSLRPSYRYPIPNAAQFLQGDPAVGVFGLSDNALADVVVCPGGKATLVAYKFLEKTTARFRSFALKLGAQTTMAIANLFNCLPLMDCAVTVYGDVGDPQVNAKKAFDILWRRLVNFARSKQVEFAVNQAQVSLATLAGQKLFGSWMANNSHLLATVYRPDAHLVLVEFPGQDTGIVGNRAMEKDRELE
jgi:hypothetical protein